MLQHVAPPPSIMDNLQTSLGGDGGGGEAAAEDAQCKLAVLGLPWETSEDTLRAYFGQFGPLLAAEVMKDRYTGKSRGFGFVTFMDAASAQNALDAEHTIEGRRCEAKVALPKGESTPMRTTRIFVARISSAVTEPQFKAYFEAYGKLQDAYMPRDHAKQGYRGIGFVTFASPDSVEKVMAAKHWLGGQEVAIDRATPKEEQSAVKSMFARLPLSAGQRRSFDNGAGIIGPGLTSVLANAGGGMAVGGVGISNLRPRDMGMGHHHHAYSQLRSLSEDRPVTQGMPGPSSVQEHGSSLRPSQAIGLNLGLGVPPAALQPSPRTAAAAMMHPHAPPDHAAAAAAAAAAAHPLPPHHPHAHAHAHALAAQQQHGMPASDMSQLLSSLARANLGGGGGAPGGGGGVGGDLGMQQQLQQLMAAAAAQSSRRSLDSAAAALKHLENNPAIANARAGPRIFVGKLTKEASEADVRQYFMRFGFVMDVYMPKAKENKLEHRGFGFVTFETEAAIQRVVSHGAHRLKGATLAIDIAMPKVEEDALVFEGENSMGALVGQRLS